MKKFENAACVAQVRTLMKFGFGCEDWTVQEASLAIKRIAENDWKVPEGMTLETIDNDYELDHPVYSDDGTINQFSREITLEGYEGTWTVVDHQEYDGDYIYELENDNYGYVTNKDSENFIRVETGHVIVDKHRNIITENEVDDFLDRYECRKCSECGELMVEGFLVEGAFDNEYYCSEDCLHKHYTEEEYSEMYENDEAFWTQWY